MVEVILPGQSPMAPHLESARISRNGSSLKPKMKRNNSKFSDSSSHVGRSSSAAKSLRSSKSQNVFISRRFDNEEDIQHIKKLFQAMRYESRRQKVERLEVKKIVSPSMVEAIRKKKYLKMVQAIRETPG